MPQNRDLSSETDSHNESLDKTDGSKGLADRVPVTRRSCLRSAGVAVASAAAIGGMGSASAKKLVHASEVSGTTYDVPSGVVRILVGQNQYGDYGDLTNALIKAEGSEVEIVSFGSGWEIRNVGIDGQTDGDHPVIDVKTDGGSGVVENVYMGDGGGNDQVGLFVKKEHSGTVTLRNIYVAGFEDNGIYASTPGKSSGGGGTTQIENCYGENNGKAHYRINGDGSYVRDSVAVSDDVGITSRGVWVRRGNAEIENTDISLTDSGSVATSAIWATGGASVDYRNSDYVTVYEFGDFDGDVDTSNVGNDPSTSPPSGVPTSASQAANGGGGSASSSSSDVDEEDSSEDESTDESSEDTEEESSSEDESTDEESRGGEGEASSEANEEATGDAEDDDLPNEVTVRSETGDDVRYEFAVDGEVEALSSGDSTSGDTASGRVHSYRDKYEFSGEFTEFRYSGPVVIDVNGQTVYRDSDS